MFENIEDHSVEPIFTIISNHPYTMSKSLQLIDPNLASIDFDKMGNLINRTPDMLIVCDVGLSSEEKTKLVACMAILVNKVSFSICLSNDTQDNALLEYVTTVCMLPSDMDTCEAINKISNSLIESVVLQPLLASLFDDMHLYFKGKGTTQYREALVQGERRIEKAMNIINSDQDLSTVAILAKGGRDILLDECEVIINAVEEMSFPSSATFVAIKVCPYFKSGEILVSAFLCDSH